MRNSDVYKPPPEKQWCQLIYAIVTTLIVAALVAFIFIIPWELLVTLIFGSLIWAISRPDTDY